MVRLNRRRDKITSRASERIFHIILDMYPAYVYLQNTAVRHRMYNNNVCVVILCCTYIRLLLCAFIDELSRRHYVSLCRPIDGVRSLKSRHTCVNIKQRRAATAQLLRSKRFLDEIVSRTGRGVLDWERGRGDKENIADYI